SLSLSLPFLPCPLSPFPTRRSSDLSIGSTAVRFVFADQLHGFYLRSATQSSGRESINKCFDGIGFGVQFATDPAYQMNDVAVILDRKSTRLNSSHVSISYAVFCLKK